jgi:hypothetical protein
MNPEISVGRGIWVPFLHSAAVRRKLGIVMSVTLLQAVIPLSARASAHSGPLAAPRAGAMDVDDFLARGSGILGKTVGVTGNVYCLNSTLCNIHFPRNLYQIVWFDASSLDMNTKKQLMACSADNTTCLGTVIGVTKMVCLRNGDKNVYQQGIIATQVLFNIIRVGHFRTSK